MSSEQELLARIRTLLALERNYLSEERTELATFRTGLTLALVSPPVISLIHFLFGESYPLTSLFPTLLYLVFALLTILGIWAAIMSRVRLKKIQQKIQLLKVRQIHVMQDSDELCSLLEDCVTLKHSPN
jgi:uncharacterized membrane protein YidH (DUF202 family)